MRNDHRAASSASRRRAVLYAGAALAGLSGGTAAPAWAQAGGTPLPATAAHPAPSAAGTAQATRPAGRLEEIVVTAQRRRENLQRVPVTVTAITAAAISRANIDSTTSLQQVTPGLTWSTANRSSLPYIRGIGSSDGSIGNESSIALYVDGVYIENTTASTLELNNIERIEVLKGPQGTLFGRNATGGLIQIITKQPSQTPSGNFELGYGNYSTVHGTGYLNQPITDQLSANLAFVFNDQQSGWGHNVITGRDVDLDHTVAFDSKILLNLGDTRFTLAGDFTNQSTDFSGERNLLPGETSFGHATSLPGFYDTQSNINPTGELVTGGVSLHAEHDFSFAKATSITSYRQTKFTSGYDLDETPVPVLQVKFLARVDAFTQELQLASNRDDRLHWIVGAFFMHRNGYNPAETLSGLAFGAPPFYGSYSLHTTVLTDTGAPYAQATYNLTPTTAITGGIRYTIEQQQFHGTETNNLGAVIGRIPADTSSTFRQPTVRAAIDHHFTNDVMAYASFNTGYKSGLYNANSLIAVPARPETVNAYEVGVKTDLLDHRLRFNAAAFDYSYKNIQLIVAADPSKGSPTNVVNAAQAKLYGLDVSVDAVPLPGLTVSLGSSYLPEAQYQNFADAPLYVHKPTGGNLVLPYFDASSRMIRAPRFTQTAAVDYQFDVGPGSLDAGVNYYYSSTFLWNTDGRFKQSPYSILNGQITYSMARTGLRYSIWARNITDTKYMSGLSETAGGDVYSPAAPRTFGFKVGYSF